MTPCFQHREKNTAIFNRTPQFNKSQFFFKYSYQPICNNSNVTTLNVTTLQSGTVARRVLHSGCCKWGGVLILQFLYIINRIKFENFLVLLINQLFSFHFINMFLYSFFFYFPWQWFFDNSYFQIRTIFLC